MSMPASRPLRNFIRASALRHIRGKDEPSHTWNVVRGDTVAVIAGRDAGKTGRIKAVLRKSNRVIVEGVNMVRKHVRAAEGVAGGIVSVEAPVHYSNVNLVDPASGKPTRVGVRYSSEGAKVRIAVKSGQEIPIPEASKTRKTTRPLTTGPLDTPLASVQQRTYTPPAELLPFLAPAAAAPKTSVYRVRTAKDPYRLPEALSAGLPRHARKKIRDRVEARAVRHAIASAATAAPAAVQQVLQ